MQKTLLIEALKNFTFTYQGMTKEKLFFPDEDTVPAMQQGVKKWPRPDDPAVVEAFNIEIRRLAAQYGVVVTSVQVSLSNDPSRDAPDSPGSLRRPS